MTTVIAQEKTYNKIKNKMYVDFMNGNLSQFLSDDQIIQVIDGISGKHRTQSRALVCVLYMTGCRPVEALKLKRDDFWIERSFLKIRVPGSKRGTNRTLSFRLKWKPTSVLWAYVKNLPMGLLVFYKYRSNYKRRVKIKKAELEEQKYRIYNDTANRMWYYIKKWFEPVIDGGISPYVLRHNRLSKLGEKGLEPEELRKFKGSRTLQSVMPYLHMTRKTSEKWARKLED